MNEGQGKMLNEKEKERHLILSSPSWKNLPEGKSLYFNGESAYFKINTASTVAVDRNSNFSIGFWFKTDQPNGTLFSSGSGGIISGEEVKGKLCMYLDNGKIVIATNGQTLPTNQINYSDNSWHHFVLSVNRSTSVQLFVDDALILTASPIKFEGLEGATMTLGARNYRVMDSGVWKNPVTDMYFKGWIDDFKIYNTPLNPDFLKYFGNVRLSGALAYLIAYYPFDKYLENDNNQMELVFEKNDQIVNSRADTSILFYAVPSSEIAPIKDPGAISKYAFNVVTSKDRILLNLTDNIDAIEHTNIAILVQDIEDLNGNKMNGTYVWNAFINRNTLVWSDSYIKKTKKNGEKMTFEVAIKNIGGEAQTFKINNIPNWLTIHPSEAIVAPQSTFNLEFTINEALNPGDYEALLDLRGDYSSFLSLDLIVGGEKPLWKPDVRKYPNYMVLIGQLKIDDIISTNEKDMVGAFVNGECVGVASPIKANDKWLIILDIHYDVANDVKLQIWDDSKGRILDAAPKLSFVTNQIIGSSSSPTIIYNVGAVTPIDVYKGWNWVSFNNADTANNNSIKSLFVGIDNAFEIKNQIGAFSRYENGSWKGNLSQYGNTSMYMINMNGDNTIYQHGQPVDVAKTSLNINAGWTWLGYTPQINTTIAEAFASLNPLAGDLIKSQDEVAVYDVSTGWEGNLMYLRPGLGYMYKSTTMRSFHYPAYSSLMQLDATIPSHVRENPSKKIAKKFINNLTMIAEISGVVVTENTQLVAKSDAEVCGISYPEFINGKYLFMMPIYSNKEKENIKFELQQNDALTPLVETINFNTNDVRGGLDSPFVFNIKSVGSDYKNVDELPISVYPNPVEDHLTIETQLKNDATIEIVDIFGRIVYTAKTSSANKINIQDAKLQTLPTGNYLLKLISNNSVITVKFVKK
jgi:hypothetical protein